MHYSTAQKRKSILINTKPETKLLYFSIKSKNPEFAIKNVLPSVGNLIKFRQNFDFHIFLWHFIQKIKKSLLIITKYQLLYIYIFQKKRQNTTFSV